MISRENETGLFRNIVIGAVVLGAGAMGVQAATISYGNRAGATVDFFDIEESATTDPVPLYGAPDNVVDDSINFDPQLFTSSATGGAADLTDGLINFIVEAKPGQYITDVTFTEFGDYTLAGAGNASTSAQVGQAIFVEVLELDNVVLADPIVLSFNSIFNPSGGTYFLPGEAGLAQPWFGVGTMDIVAELLSLNITQKATAIEISSNNVLATTSQPGTVAYIAKKDLNIGIGTDVPEPAALSLAIIGTAALLRRR